MPELKTWNWETLVREARDKLVSDGYPVPRKPDIPLKDMEFPTNVDDLKDMALANLTIRINNWYSFATASVAFRKAEYMALDEVFEVNMGERIYILGKSIEGKTPAKDVLRGQIIATEADMASLFALRLKLSQQILTLEGLMKSLEIQVIALREEGIRRASTRRLESHM